MHKNDNDIETEVTQTSKAALSDLHKSTNASQDPNYELEYIQKNIPFDFKSEHEILNCQKGISHVFGN